MLGPAGKCGRARPSVALDVRRSWSVWASQMGAKEELA